MRGSNTEQKSKTFFHKPNDMPYCIVFICILRSNFNKKENWESVPQQQKFKRASINIIFNLVLAVKVLWFQLVQMMEFDE